MKITGIDSIRKKINSVGVIKEQLNLNNLNLICDRVENIERKFDIVISRAVADLAKISEYALTHILKKTGILLHINLKSVRRIRKCKICFKKKYHAEVIDIIEYTLPLDEVYERNLVCIKNIKCYIY